MKPAAALILIKLVHTVAWAFFAGCIICLPIAAFYSRFDMAVVLMCLVGFEMVVVALNRWACPLTSVAARFTTDRRDNFDIFLPLLLARYNKQIFGSMFLMAVGYTAYQWWRQSGA